MEDIDLDLTMIMHKQAAVAAVVEAAAAVLNQDNSHINWMYFGCILYVYLMCI